MQKLIFLVFFWTIINNVVAMETEITFQNTQQITLAGVAPDLFINIPHRKSFGVSELVLRKHSPHFFLQLINAARIQNLNAIDVIIEDSDIDAFTILLHILHQNIKPKNIKNPGAILKIIKLAEKFACDKDIVGPAIKRALNANFKSDLQKNTRQDDLLLFRLFHISDDLASLKENDIYKQLIKIPYFDGYFKNKFPYLNAIAPILWDIPPFALECFLEGTIKTDFENSIVAIIFKWAEIQLGSQKDDEDISQEQRDKLIQNHNAAVIKLAQPFWRYVNWHEITDHYWNNIVVKLGKFYSSPELQEILDQVHLNKTAAKSDRVVKSIFNRADIPGDIKNAFVMWVMFDKINEWKDGKLYYGEPIVKNGYFFYLYVKPCGKQLQMFIRCMGIGDKSHTLLVKIKFELLMNNNKKREFPIKNQNGDGEFFNEIFTDFSKSIGLCLNNLDPNKPECEDEEESLKNIKLFKTDLTVDGKIIIQMTMQLPES